jgi:hypothetical protein
MVMAFLVSVEAEDAEEEEEVVATEEDMVVAAATTVEEAMVVAVTREETGVRESNLASSCYYKQFGGHVSTIKNYHLLIIFHRALPFEVPKANFNSCLECSEKDPTGRLLRTSGQALLVEID